MLIKLGNNARIKKNIAGYTMLEMIITIAVFAVISLLITSMTIYMNNFTNDRREMFRLDEEISDAEEIIKTWFSAHDDAYNEITAVYSDEVNGHYICFNGNEYLRFEDGVIQTESGGEVKKMLDCERIENIDFRYDSTLNSVDCKLYVTAGEKQRIYDILLYKKV